MAPRIIEIGGLADLPAGESRSFGAGAVLLESLDQGLRARTTDGACRAILADAYGRLSVDLGIPWDDDTVFSIMIGGPVRLDASREENDERR
jgi:hypothetical protein